MRCSHDRGARRRASERGAVTVEFAVALPVLAVAVSSAIAGVVLVDAQGRLQVAAATAARAYGRGDTEAGRAAVERLAPRAAATVSRSDGFVCVVTERRAGPGPLSALTLRGDACAATDGR